MDTGALVDRIHQSLREAILAGDHAPGARLKLSALACDLGVSTTPVREAISRLEKVGLVDVVPYVGPKVRAATPAEAADLFDVRIALEGLAARLAAERASHPAQYPGRVTLSNRSGIHQSHARRHDPR